MIQRIKQFYKQIKYNFSKERCYDEMTDRGSAEDGKCVGLTGGDRFTDYLNYSCVDCPYLDLSYRKVESKGVDK